MSEQATQFSIHTLGTSCVAAVGGLFINCLQLWGYKQRILFATNSLGTNMVYPPSMRVVLRSFIHTGFTSFSSVKNYLYPLSPGLTKTTTINI